MEFKWREIDREHFDARVHTRYFGAVSLTAYNAGGDGEYCKWTVRIRGDLTDWGNSWTIEKAMESAVASMKRLMSEAIAEAFELSRISGPGVEIAPLQARVLEPEDL